MKENSLEEYPRVLVISSSAFSKSTNNGKTLASFFKKFPPDKIAQLYFNSEIPNDDNYSKFYRVTDKDILKSFCSKMQMGNPVKEHNTMIINSDKSNSNFKKLIRGFVTNSEIARIFREIIWLSGRWKTNTLEEWLNDINPEIIFFCAGDGGFSYSIAKFIKDKYNAKNIIYITDDYILPRRTINPFWWIRRNFILKNMKEAVLNADMFMTISEEMRNQYRDLFGVDSKLAINMTASMKDSNISVSENEVVEFIYTGGLHYKRYKTLQKLAVAIKKYNEQSKDRKAFLKIYSSNEPIRKIKKLLNHDNVSQFCGSLNSEELKFALNNADVLVHVESFDIKSIEATRLSISTKIPEYLSLEKPVLAIGPKEVASMKYLEDAALCVIDESDIYKSIAQIMSDEILRIDLCERAKLKYKMNHKENEVLEKFTDNIISLIK